ncbi:hypothetical protein RN001_010145 [Aquatica leii]|uniref:NodB homology domain-containing protein n=1 Tax=Aquatica leii TaxID=1421715 RepID=A0AAN7PUG9_9COLE|nr:hypothetical protein RN001_010145 [Aquatica leii]
MLTLFFILCVSVGTLALPKPEIKEVAKECDPNACKLPNCLCLSTNPPAGLKPADIPQFVLLTFDDAINVRNIPYYKEAFYNRKNPNNCSIGTTYFVTHEYTDYSLVHELASKGHEIALHSITHQSNNSYWQNLDLEGYKREIADQINLVAHFANISNSSIKGIRVPFLQLGGNNSFQVIKDSGLTYDCSWPTQSYIDSGLFPYTLDYATNQDCPVGPCPNASIPGVWVIPMVDWRDQSNVPCAMVDQCINIPTDVNGIVEFMKTNFNRHYNGSRSPFGFYLHAAWFDRNTIYFEAYQKFLDYLNTIKDVYMVSANTVIEWMKNPVTKDVYIKNSKCNPIFNNTCAQPKSCRLMKGEEERYMTVCSSSCPKVYPCASTLALPKPEIKEVAKECDPNACKLPNCLCFSTNPPAGLKPADIPQFVLLTFDDAIKIDNIQYYKDAFYNRKNPNNCSIGTTYFVSHEYTDYSLVHELVSKGHEIALHSITHQTPNSYWKDLDLEGYKREIADQVKLVTHFANISSSSIKGIRVPFLELGGNNSFQMIKDSGLTYDCSWPTQTYIESGLFPYTLDYASNQDCPTGVCPNASIPGVWVIPMVDWRDQSNVPCAMVDQCINIPTDVNGIVEFMKTNFNRHYNGSRSPFGFYVHAAWFNKNPIYFEAYQKFLDYLNTIEDVYLVSANNVIEWMKNPVTKDVYIKNSKCNQIFNNTCAQPKSCRLMKGEEERYMTICSNSCPNVYPWLNNPLGN